jgi:hypothetical protein
MPGAGWPAKTCAAIHPASVALDRESRQFAAWPQLAQTHATSQTPYASVPKADLATQISSAERVFRRAGIVGSATFFSTAKRGANVQCSACQVIAEPRRSGSPRPNCGYRRWCLAQANLPEFGLLCLGLIEGTVTLPVVPGGVSSPLLNHRRRCRHRRPCRYWEPLGSAAQRCWRLPDCWLCWTRPWRHAT